MSKGKLKINRANVGQGAKKRKKTLKTHPNISVTTSENGLNSLVKADILRRGGRKYQTKIQLYENFLKQGMEKY